MWPMFVSGSELEKNSVCLTTDKDINPNDLKVQVILNNIYDQLIQENFLNVDHVKNIEETSEENQELENLKQRIIRNQCQLDSVKLKLQTISFRTEVELLNKLQKPNYGNILQNIKKEDYERRLGELDATIKKYQIQQIQQNENKFESGSKQIQNIIEEVINNIEI